MSTAQSPEALTDALRWLAEEETPHTPYLRGLKEQLRRDNTFTSIHQTALLTAYAAYLNRGLTHAKSPAHPLTKENQLMTTNNTTSTDPAAIAPNPAAIPLRAQLAIVVGTLLLRADYDGDKEAFNKVIAFVQAGTEEAKAAATAALYDHFWEHEFVPPPDYGNPNASSVMLKPLIVSTFYQVNRPPRVVTIDFAVQEDRKWLARHCKWAFNKGCTVRSYPHSRWQHAGDHVNGGNDFPHYSREAK